MANILITNGSGFIGRNLIRSLSPTHNLIVGFRDMNGACPVKDNVECVFNTTVYSEFDNVFRNFEIDTVIHNAGIPKNDSIEKLLDSNVTFTSKILEECNLHTRLIFLSSSTVYGDCETYFPKRETDRPAPTSAYGVSKLAAEELIMTRQRRNKVNSVLLRLCANVGLYATHGLLPDVIRKLRAYGPISVFGPSPGSIKPFIHVSDTCKIIERFIDDLRHKTGVYNVTTPDFLTVERVVEIAMEELGVEKEIVWENNDAYANGDNRIVSLSNAKYLTVGPQLTYYNSELAIRQAIKEGK